MESQHFCTACGEPIHEGAHFCEKCGHQLGAPGTGPSVPQGAPSPPPPQGSPSPSAPPPPSYQGPPPPPRQQQPSGGGGGGGTIIILLVVLGVCMVLGFGFCCIIGPILGTATSGASQFNSLSKSVDKAMERQQKLMAEAIELEKMKKEQAAREAKKKEALLQKAADLAAKAAAAVDWKKVAAEGRDGAAERKDVLSYVKETLGQEITDVDAKAAADKAVDAALAKARKESKK